MLTVDQVKKDEICGLCSTHGRNNKLIQNFGRIREGKRKLRRSKRRLEYKFRMDLRERGWEVFVCIYLAQNRDQWQSLVSTIMKFKVQ
jgi:hypothetical protein